MSTRAGVNATGASSLVVEGVSKRYGETVALDRLSLEVHPGKISGFVGPNGAGKTTAMRIIVGLLEADAGQVFWGGAPIGGDRRRRIGYMPEERGLYPKMRVDQQLEYFGELHGLSAEEARGRTADWLGVLDIADRSEDNVEQLSLGNQQRVQLAASLVFEPEILILDEPFSGLDPIGVDLLSDVLKSVCEERGVPVLFSSHQLELVERICDAVAIVREGSLVASGPVPELKRSRSGNVWRVRLKDRVDWDPAMPGVRRLGPSEFELVDDADPDRLLDRAREAGRVVEFAESSRSLAELFRESVSDGEESR